MKKLIYIFAILMLVSCYKDNEWRTFTVPAGKERCSHWPDMQLGSDALDFWFATDESWVWTEEGEHFSLGGKAKIAGFSDGGHRDASCRLGYQCNNGVMEVGLFVEAGASYHWRVLDTVVPNAVYYCRLSREGGWYVARLGDRVARVEAPDDRWVSYVLFPCMAGSFRLSHDWNVGIKFDK